MGRILGLVLLVAFALPAWAQDAAPEPGAEKKAPATPTPAGEKVVEPGDWVWVDYAVWYEDGTLMDTTSQREPLQLRQGQGTMPKEVETQLLGMAIETHKTVRITPEQGYGEVKKNLFESVPLEQIPESAREVGHRLIMKDEDGRGHALRVHKIEGDRAILDRNHPLAGHTLTFDLRIVEIYRPPAAEN